ncbi:MAG TPA: ABC transporter ATP-binding protein [Geminicoccaceae bacterium]|nr:ABC transporter ATP-binding protein [Geminicoccaceae bacterium]
MSLLEVRDLRVRLPTEAGTAYILNGIDLEVERGGRLGIVGESGCGKSMTALAIMGLLPDQAMVEGAVCLDGLDLLALDEPALCRIRGRRIGMIFQEPMTALNPVMAIGAQIAEGPRRQLGLSRADAEARVLRLMERVGLPPARFSPRLYPHQLSGGQRQRVGIAIALASEPEILIADEPTTALDVTIQAQVLRLLDEIVAEAGMGLVLVTHDLGVIAGMTDRMLVMYAGFVVESGPTAEVFAAMAHPYTAGLFRALPPEVGGVVTRAPLATIPGQVPSPLVPPRACPFVERCWQAQDICHREMAPLREVGPGHRAACHFPLAGAPA